MISWCDSTRFLSGFGFSCVLASLVIGLNVGEIFTPGKMRSWSCKCGSVYSRARWHSWEQSPSHPRPSLPQWLFPAVACEMQLDPHRWFSVILCRSSGVIILLLSQKAQVTDLKSKEKEGCYQELRELSQRKRRKKEEKKRQWDKTSDKDDRPFPGDDM